jgi:protoheme IX farnesyltransferase
LGGLAQTASSTACDNAALCRSWSLPSAASGSTISDLQRGAAFATSCVAVALAAFGAARLRGDRRSIPIACAILLLVGAQLAAMLAARHAASWGVWTLGVHFSATALLFALAVWLVVAPWAARHTVAVSNLPSARYLNMLAVNVALVFVVLLTGAISSRDAVGPDCAGWPLCGGGMTQLRSGTIDDQVLHRGAVALAGILLAVVAAATVRTRRGDRSAMLPMAGVVVVFAAEVAASALSVWDSTSAARSAWHFTAAAIVFGLLIVAWITQHALATAARPAIVGAHDASVSSLPWRVIARDYLRVTKPTIIVLLLVTTLGAMLIAGNGWPSFGLVLATLLGGALASGGAGALNCYYDRDIDVVMARTRKRPIPTGHLTPTQVRTFGLALSALAIVELAWLVNPLAAALALAGNLFYVGIYTRWLKRSTPQNIVIGGAAGSFPPLVGWAAVTGRLDAGAFILFAIIVYWTPPHFWSLALLKANDYRRAGIPMLPVTAGERVTRRCILLYSVLLVAVTVLMTVAGVVGALYLVAALVLGGVFVGMAARMYREDTSRLAWPLFKYSNYYLAALLAVMALDKALGF